MAKNILIAVLFLCLVASLVFGLFKASESNDHQKTIQTATRERDEARAAEYMAQEALKLTRDTLEKAYLVATNAKRDANKAVYEAQKLRKEHEIFVFKNFSSDTARLRAWSELYPTLFGR